MVFACQKPSIQEYRFEIRELGLGFERDFSAGKIAAPMEKAIKPAKKHFSRYSLRHTSCATSLNEGGFFFAKPLDNLVYI